MKAQYLILAFLFLWVEQLSAQALEFNYQGGFAIANHPRFPELKSMTHNFEFNYVLEPKAKAYWSILHKFPTLSLTTSVQTLGNKKILGQAIAFAPVMGFYLMRKKHWLLQGQLGWGLAYFTKHYDSFKNPKNIVIGTAVNAYTTARLRLAYRAGSWEPNLSFLISHYSNSNARAPNLGMNIPALQAGLRYHLAIKKEAELGKELADLPDFKKRWSPFLQVGLGMSAAISRGPFFPCYTSKIGVEWQYSRKALAGAGLEYSFNGAVYQFRRHNNPETTFKQDFNRYAVFLSHEFLFGHFGFYTLGGVYLNKHVEQRSLIATQVGLNFYPRSTIWFQKHQVRIGVNIRAYFGLAEFALLELGYRF